MFSCRTSGDQNEGTHPDLLLMLKAASQHHKHDCIKHAPLITLSKVLGFFKKTESKCAICTTLLLEMWWKRQWKGKKKKKSSECCYHCPSGPPEPTLLPPANSSNQLPVLSQWGIAFAAQGSGRNAGFFPFEGWFQSKWGDCPTAQGLEDIWFLHTLSTISNGLTTSGSPSRKQHLWPSQVPTNPKLRWLRYDWRYDR